MVVQSKNKIDSLCVLYGSNVRHIFNKELKKSRFKSDYVDTLVEVVYSTLLNETYEALTIRDRIKMAIEKTIAYFLSVMDVNPLMD